MRQGALFFDRGDVFVLVDAMAESEEVRTMMGVSPEQAARFMVDEGADVIGLNCGTGIDMVKAADTIARFRSVSGSDVEDILRHALEEASEGAGAVFAEKDGALFLDL